MKCRSSVCSENGYLAAVTIILLFIIVGSALAYLRWSADESVEFKRQYAATNAYYIAQSAISKDVIPELIGLQGEPPAVITGEGDTDEIDFDLHQSFAGNYQWKAQLAPEKSSQSGYGSAFNGITQYYNVEITGTIKYTAFNRFNNEREIEVDTTLYIKFHSSDSWAQYLYFTNFETTLFEEKIKFQSNDTLWWDVYSNDQIAIMGSPVFYGQVFTTAPDFWYGTSPNPQFLGGDPVFNADTIPFYETLDELRSAASQQGHFYSGAGTHQFRCIFRGNRGPYIYKWPLGMPFDEETADLISTGGPPTYGAFFIDGRLEVTGTDPETRIDMGVDGMLSLGCSGDMWLLGNIRYVDADETGNIPEGCTNMLGLMSESNVLIANNFENGRDNGYNIAPGDLWRHSIVIDAGVVALGESFSFEDQNDIITAYGGNLPEWYYSEGPSPDKRGNIHLWGQISQYRRGYVHRSNHDGTGYYKDYRYDTRFFVEPPPYYPCIEGQLGSSRSIEAWGAGKIGEESFTKTGEES